VTRPPGIPQSHVVVKNLVKTYPNGHCAVDSVSMEINAGEVVSIIGPSGAGKSTFLRCINLLETPTRGSVSVGDQTLVFDAATKHVKRDALQRFRRGVGMVFQSFNLYPHMTILRNVTLPQQKVLGVSRARAEEVGLAMLDRVGLANRANSYPSQCSGGQQQRAAIARALALQPHLMLFDEPTSALDPEVGVEVLGIMKELAEGGMTMMVVTHEMDFARHVSDRVVIMVDGAVLEEGAPGRVMDAPEHERSQRFLSAVFGR
jgi:polar amino acid transport system ATP-binding protein